MAVVGSVNGPEVPVEAVSPEPTKDGTREQGKKRESAKDDNITPVPHRGHASENEEDRYSDAGKSSNHLSR